MKKYYTVIAKEKIVDAVESGEFHLLGSYETMEDAEENKEKDFSSFKEYKSCIVHVGILVANGDLDHLLYKR